MSHVALRDDDDRRRRRGKRDARRLRPQIGTVLAVLTVGAGLLAGPAAASATRHVAAGGSTAASSTKAAALNAMPAKHKATWHWSKKFSLGAAAGLKKHVAYATYGLACPTVHLCIVPMDGTSTNPPYNSPAGDFYTTSPARAAAGWKFSRWDEDYAPGDSLSINNISCAPAGNATDCNIAGRAPVAGSYNESYGATVFQTGTPTAKNWGAAGVDDNSPGFGAVSCFVNVQCAEVDDQGSIITTAGASVTSDASVFPADANVSGIWAVGCAPHQSGQHNFFCAAVDQNAAGSIAWSVNPGSENTKWTVARLKHHTLFDVACLRPGTCIINSDGELIATSGDTKSKSWTHSFKKVTLPKSVGRTVLAVFCNEKLCAVAGDATKLGQYVAISTDPDHGHWHTIPLGKTHKPVLHGGIAYLSCPSTKLCLVANTYGQTTVGRAG